MATVIQQLAGLSDDVHYGSLPAEAIKAAKRHILDSLACAFGGLQGAPTRSVRKLFQALDGGNQAAVWGHTDAATPVLATLANGTALRYLDYNDYYFGRDPSHPSGQLAPTLAIAEAVGASGRDLISALLLAYEVQVRLSDFSGKPNLWLRGWDHVSNVPYAAAAACGYLLALPRAALAHAMAIAGIQGHTLSEIRHGKIPNQKAYAEAKAGCDGLLAAFLAGNGMTGSETIFEGDYGYRNVVAGACDFESLCRPIQTFNILRTSLKTHPVESMTQAPVQAALALHETHKVQPEDISTIDIGLYDFAYQKPSWDDSKLRPTTRETADHSFTFCVAAALIDGEIGPAQFTNDRFRSQDVRDLVRRISLSVVPEFNSIYPETLPGQVTITLTDGQTLRKTVTYPVGHPKNPQPDDAIEAKFRGLGAPVLPKSQLDEIVDGVSRLDAIDDVRQFTALLRTAQ